MLKVLIADSSDDFTSALTGLLMDHYLVKTAHDGATAVDILRTFRPDAVIIDLMLPEIDGADVLRIGASCDVHPIVLAMTRCRTDYLQGLAEELSIDYIMHHPCTAQAVHSRLQHILKYHSNRQVQMPTPEENLVMVLDVLGVNQAHDGYYHILKAVHLLAQDPLQSITKVIYPEVGSTFGGNGPQVERSIRSAIQYAWNNRDERIWACYFKPGKDGSIQKPTNQSFLLMLLRLLKIWRKSSIKA